MNDIAIRILRVELESLLGEKGKIEATLKGLNDNITSLERSISSLSGPPSLVAIPSPVFKAKTKDTYKVCLLSNGKGEVRVMSSQLKLPEVLSAVEAQIGTLDKSRCAVFHTYELSKARKIAEIARLYVQDMVTDKNGIYQREAFDYLVAALTSMSGNISVEHIDWFSTEKPPLGVVTEMPEIASFDHCVRWNFDKFHKQWRAGEIGEPSSMKSKMQVIMQSINSSR